MHKTGRRIFGVIAAQAADMEQREILSGIISAAQAADIDIAVLSNIYNPVDTAEELAAENGIYDLIDSEEFDGFLLISESVFNEDVQGRILTQLQNKADLPVVAIGTPLPGLCLPHFHFINTSDEADLEDMTNHLIEQHKFTDIHILTGHRHLEVSHKRVDGYRNALEAHGIPFMEENVFYGDFWLNSGKAQAQKYISGELKFPQALICCNDYMAYGFLDECMMQDVPLPDSAAVVGYEYVRERRHHTPLLTTYQRNRRALGEEAVRLLLEKLETGMYGEFTPPQGMLITGDTCGCGAKQQDTKRELNDMQTKATFDFLNLFSRLEHRLTECRNLDEFVARCWDFQFMIRSVNGLYLCLYEDWYEETPSSSNMVCYNLLYHEPALIYRKTELSSIFRGEAAPYYFCPLFFAQKELGYAVVRFDHPDTFDHIFRNWLKSIANGLEFLRMKNDIRYLTECQSLSEQRDSLTGMYNEKGIRSAVQSLDKRNLYMVMLRICLTAKNRTDNKHEERIYAILDVAEAVRQFCTSQQICGRISDDTFLCFVPCERDADFLKNHLSAVLIQHTGYMDHFGLDSFACAAVKCTEASYLECRVICEAQLEKQLRIYAERRLNPHYRELRHIRDYIYRNPENTFDQQQVYALYQGSEGYLRKIYRLCYGVTLHDDCISARTAKVRYLLAVSLLHITEIAEQCGYHDRKYLMRQFRQETGLTVLQYRSIIN